MRKWMKLVEGQSWSINESVENPVLQAIEAVARKFGRNKLYGGNCGTFALALAKKFAHLSPRILIICEDDFGDDAEPEDIIAAEIRLYHVAVAIGDIIYDGDGIVSRDSIADFIEDEYEDDAPAMFNFAVNTPNLEMLIRTDTDWSISEAEFAQALKLKTMIDTSPTH